MTTPNLITRLRLVQISKKVYIEYMNYNYSHGKNRPHWEARAEEKAKDRSYTGKDHRGVIVADNIEVDVNHLIHYCEYHGHKYRVLKETLEAVI